MNALPCAGMWTYSDWLEPVTSHVHINSEPQMPRAFWLKTIEYAKGDGFDGGYTASHGAQRAQSSLVADGCWVFYCCFPEVKCFAHRLGWLCTLNFIVVVLRWSMCNTLYKLLALRIAWSFSTKTRWIPLTLRQTLLFVVAVWRWAPTQQWKRWCTLSGAMSTTAGSRTNISSRTNEDVGHSGTIWCFHLDSASHWISMKADDAKTLGLISTQFKTHLSHFFKDICRLSFFQEAANIRSTILKDLPDNFKQEVEILRQAEAFEVGCLCRAKLTFCRDMRDLYWVVQIVHHNHVHIWL